MMPNFVTACFEVCERPKSKNISLQLTMYREKMSSKLHRCSHAKGFLFTKSTWIQHKIVLILETIFFQLRYLNSRLFIFRNFKMILNIENLLESQCKSNQKSICLNWFLSKNLLPIPGDPCPQNCTTAQRCVLPVSFPPSKIAQQDYEIEKKSNFPLIKSCTAAGKIRFLFEEMSSIFVPS